MDLALANFFLFLKFELHMKIHFFDNIPASQWVTMCEVKVIPVEVFKHSFDLLYDCSKACTVVGEDHMEN